MIDEIFFIDLWVSLNATEWNLKTEIFSCKRWPEKWATHQLPTVTKLYHPISSCGGRERSMPSSSVNLAQDG